VYDERVSDEPTRTTRTLSIDARIVAILTHVRDHTVMEMRRRLSERHEAGRNELPEEEIEMISRIAGTVARTLAETAVTQAYNLGVERATRDPTVR